MQGGGPALRASVLAVMPLSWRLPLDLLYYIKSHFIDYLLSGRASHVPADRLPQGRCHPTANRARRVKGKPRFTRTKPRLRDYPVHLPFGRTNPNSGSRRLSQLISPWGEALEQAEPSSFLREAAQASAPAISCQTLRGVPDAPEGEQSLASPVCGKGNGLERRRC